MSADDLIQSVATLFEKRFAEQPGATAFAPGRVNLLGEHTDYNDGFVLPMPLAYGTAVALGFGGAAGRIEVASTDFDGLQTRSLDEAKTGNWSDYVLGSLVHFLDGRLPEQGVQVMVTTNLPVGSGLSSSAALEVAIMRAACDLFEVEMTHVELAVLARKAENEFMGVPCGIMDQYSVSVGAQGTAVFLDTRSLVSRVIPLPASHNFVVIHSGVGHELAASGYKTRVAECEAARAELKVDSLSDLTPDDLPRINELPAPLDGRARHIVTENDRVQRAIRALADGQIADFAQLMTQSHVSQRDDYEVSVPQIDALVEGALGAGAEGARLTGGGFGGSIVAFVAKDRVAEFSEDIAKNFPQARIKAVT